MCPAPCELGIGPQGCPREGRGQVWGARRLSLPKGALHSLTPPSPSLRGGHWTFLPLQRPRAGPRNAGLGPGSIQRADGLVLAQPGEQDAQARQSNEEEEEGRPRQATWELNSAASRGLVLFQGTSAGAGQTPQRADGSRRGHTPRLEAGSALCGRTQGGKDTRYPDPRTDPSTFRGAAAVGYKDLKPPARSSKEARH